MTAVEGDGPGSLQFTRGSERASSRSAEVPTPARDTRCLTDDELLDLHRDRPEVGQLAVQVRAPLLKAFPKGGGYVLLAELVIAALGKKDVKGRKTEVAPYAGPEMGPPVKDHPQKRWHVRPMARAYSGQFRDAAGPSLDTAAAILNLIVPAGEREATANHFADLYERRLGWRPDLLNRERLAHDLALESIPKARKPLDDMVDGAGSPEAKADSDQTTTSRRTQLVDRDSELRALVQQRDLTLQENAELRRKLHELSSLPIMQSAWRYERISQWPLREVPEENLPAAVRVLVVALDQKHLRARSTAVVDEFHGASPASTQEDLAVDAEIWREKGVAARLVTAKLPMRIRRTATIVMAVVTVTTLLCFFYILLR